MTVLIIVRTKQHFRLVYCHGFLPPRLTFENISVVLNVTTERMETGTDIGIDKVPTEKKNLLRFPSLHILRLELIML